MASCTVENIEMTEAVMGQIKVLFTLKIWWFQPFYSALIFNSIRQHVTVCTPIGCCCIASLVRIKLWKILSWPIIVFQVVSQNLYSVYIQIFKLTIPSLLPLYQCVVNYNSTIYFDSSYALLSMWNIRESQIVYLSQDI